MAGSEPRRGASLLSILASSALAGLAVIVLVGVLILAFGEDGDDGGGGAGDEAQQADPGVPAATVLPSPSVTPGPATPKPVAKVPVVIFNQTTVSGLAASFREKLEAGGWTVAAVDDFRGNVPATTVYFPPGLRPAAKALMAQFPEIGRIRPAFSGISTTQLTVILSKDFPTAQ